MTAPTISATPKKALNQRATLEPSVFSSPNIAGRDRPRRPMFDKVLAQIDVAQDLPGSIEGKLYRPQ
jgi:hypothetical protein